MKKYLFGTLAAASILGTAAIAHAGVYYVTCGWVATYYGWAYVCG